MEPTAPVHLDVVRAINALALILFTTGMALAALLATLRYVRYHRAHERAPELLKRDVVARGTLVLPLLLVLGFRVLEVDPYEVWWGGVFFALTSLLAVIGVWLTAYYEAFVIERRIDD